MHSVLKRSNWILPASLLLAAVLVLGGSSFVKANPLDIGTSNHTATTTVSYLTPGTATTTYTYDLWNGGSADQIAADKLALAVQFTASSTSSVLGWNYQFSEDGVDWYDDNTLTATATAQAVSTGQTSSWTAASSGILRKIVTLPYSPTRYVRVNFSDTGAGAGVWATFVSQKQEPN